MDKSGCLVFSLALLFFCTSRQLSEGKTCVHKDAIPKKDELQRLGIITGIAGSYNGYSEVGTLLLKDDYGDVIGALKEEYRSTTALVEEIFHRWTAGRGAKPVSWAGLVTYLRLAKLNRLADNIESAYCTAKDSHTVTDEGALDEQGPPMTRRSRRPVDEAHAPTGLQTWIMYTFTAAIIVATCYIRHRCFTPPPESDKAAIRVRTATNTTNLKLIQPARVANDCDAETNYIYIRDYWKLDDITLPGGKPLKGDGTTVAIIDLGLSMEHRSLHNKRENITGRNFVREKDGSVDTEKWHGEGDTLHGTQIASIIGGCTFTTSDGTSYPGGIVPNADLYLCRAVYPKEIEDAFQHLRDAKKVDVICISLTMDLNGVEGIRDRLGELAERGVVCVAAAGNKGKLQQHAAFPAFNQNVLSVGALKSTGQLADITPTRGINVYAPGENICVPSQESVGMMIDCGTSYAAAEVTGIILLLIQCAGTVNDKVRKLYHKLEFLKQLCSSDEDNLCINQCLLHPQKFLQRLANDEEYIRQLIRDHYDIRAI